MRRLFCLAVVTVLAAVPDVPTAEIGEVLRVIDPASGRAADTATEFAVRGIVSALATLANDQVLAFVQAPGQAGLPVWTTLAEAGPLVMRHEVSLSGRLAEGPLGFPALQIRQGSLKLLATNKAFGASEPRGPGFFKDASSLAGRYVQLTNVTMAGGQFPADGLVTVNGGAETVTLRVSVNLAGKPLPEGEFNVFGVPVKADGQWQLLASRLLPVNGRQMLTLATKHTCITCHNPDLKVVGPSYRDVAARYKDDPGAVAKLVHQIEVGGTGKWGNVSMLPLGVKVPADDRRLLAEWVMGYRWDALLAE